MLEALGHPLALHVTPATAINRAEVGRVTAAVQEARSESVELVYVGHDDTGEQPAQAARANGIALEVAHLPVAMRDSHSALVDGSAASPTLGGRAPVRVVGARSPPRPR